MGKKLTPEQEGVLQKEKQYAGVITGILDNIISDAEKDNVRLQKGIKDMQEYLVTLKDEKEKTATMQDIEKASSYIMSNYNRIQSSTKIRNNPFFSKIVFDDVDGENTFYIGLKDVYLNKMNYVLDWRAPISSLYYYSNFGKTYYDAPMGRINVDLKLKRQFKVKNGDIVFYIDTDNKIDDAVLQEALSENASSYMKNIVQTIQEEQNKIIREDLATTVVINGVAGSGKTSIAMHRIAYLLYSNREKLRNENALIISPNLLFSEYISQLLPELDEENIATVSLDRILKQLTCVENVQTKDKLLESVLGYDEDRYDNVKKKYTFEYFEQMRNYLTKINKRIPKLLYEKEYKYLNDLSARLKEETFYLDTKVMDQETFERLYHIDTDSSDVYNSLVFSAEKIVNYYFYFEKENKRATLAKKLTLDMLKILRPERLFNDFLKRNGYKEVDVNNLPYEDLTGYAFFTLSLLGFKKDTYIKHLFLDEMQDYDATALYIIKKMYPEANFTIVGDFEQNLLVVDNNTKALKFNFPTAKFFNLFTSYRSTNNIIKLAYKVLGTEKPEQSLVRDGKEPQIINCNSVEEKFKLIQEEIIRQNNNKRKVAVLCKTRAEAEEVSKYLPDSILILNETDNRLFSAKSLITTTYFSKGLEFDTVIIPDVSDKNFKKIQDKQNLYVAITRALHEVNLYYTGELTDYLK